MIIGLGALLGIHWFLFLVDELAFHRKHGIAPREKWGHPIDLFLCAMLAGYTVVFQYGEAPSFPFLILLFVAFFAITKDEFIYAERCSGAEQWVHAMRYLIHPLALLAIAGLWPLMRGVNFMVGMVLPFDPGYLRPVIGGYAIACLVLGAINFGYWLRKRPTGEKNLLMGKSAANAKANTKAPATPVKSSTPQAKTTQP